MSVVVILIFIYQNNYEVRHLTIKNIIVYIFFISILYNITILISIL